MSKMEFEWHDTGVIKQQVVSSAILLVVIWTMLGALILTGLMAALGGVLMGAFITLGLVVIGAYVTWTDHLKKNPTTVGLSENGIRLKYHDGHHIDILWDNVEEIVYFSSSKPSKIIHKDDTFTRVFIPKKIIEVMKTKLQEMKTAAEKVE